MAAEAVLYYFDGRGRAEIVRMMLCAGNIKYREVDFTTREQYVKMMEDGELMYNQVPLLKIDGINLVQTNALNNYISAKAGLDGSDAAEKAWVDMYYEGSRDLNAPFLSMLFIGTVEETLKKAEGGLTKYLPIFNKALEKSASGFLVGANMTRADVGLMEPLLSIIDYHGAEKLDAYPNIKAFVSKMSGIESIAHYLKNVRKSKNTPEYVTTVIKVLAMG